MPLLTKRSAFIATGIVICTVVLNLALLASSSEDKEEKTKTYQYPSGQTKLKEVYRDGSISKSIWYYPEGEVAHATNWSNGNGMSYYLRNDGTLRAVIRARDGMADGTGVFFRKDGSVDRVVLFDQGDKVKQQEINWNNAGQ